MILFLFAAIGINHTALYKLPPPDFYTSNMSYIIRPQKYILMVFSLFIVTLTWFYMKDVLLLICYPCIKNIKDELVILLKNL